jgi:hypothetical protein
MAPLLGGIIAQKIEGEKKRITNELEDTTRKRSQGSGHKI